MSEGGYQLDGYVEALMYRVTTVLVPVVAVTWILLRAGMRVVGLFAFLAVVLVNYVMLGRAAEKAGGEVPFAGGVGTKAGRACWRAAGDRLRLGHRS